MTQENDGADIAWMRRLAEEGATGPMRGASILMAAGIIYGGASLLHWSVLTGLLDLPPAAFSALWGAATLLFLALLTVILMRRRGRGGVVTAANRAAGTVWMGVGIGIFFLMASMTTVSARTSQEVVDSMLALLPSVVMVFYGMGWAVTAAMQRSRPLWGLAGASFLAAPLIGLLAGQDALYLAYAAALFLLMALPGALLMRAGARADRA